MKKQLLSLILIISLHKVTFAMDGLEKTNPQHVQKLAPRQYWVGCLEPINPQYNADPYNRPNKLSELIAGFNNLLTNQIPFMPGFHVYYQSDDGRVWIASRRSPDTLAPQVTVKLFDAERTRTNFLVRGPEFNFSFAYTQGWSTETRKHPPLNFSIPMYLQPFRQSYEQMQEGHGGDQFDSRDGMGYDFLDFMGQYEGYNEKIRNPLVRFQIRKLGGSYAEYAIAAYNPPLTMGGTFIAEAYLFLKYVNNALECYLFPNYPMSFFNAIKAYLPKGRNSPYLKFMDMFKIDLGARINLCPFIHTPQVTDEEIIDRVESNFRTADAIVRGRLHLVPQEKQGFYPPQAIQSFHYRMALHLYEQAASIEMFSIFHKLSLVEKFIDDVPSTEPGIKFFQPSSAKFWLNVSEDQVRNTLTPLEDKIMLYNFHTSSHQLIEGEEIRRLQDKSKAGEVYEQLFDQALGELSFENDVDDFMKLVDKIPENSGTHSGAMFFGILSNMLSDIFNSYGIDDPTMYGFGSVEDVDDDFLEDWIEMDEDDKELVNTIRKAQKDIMETSFNETEPTQEELVDAFITIQKMMKEHDQFS